MYTNRRKIKFLVSCIFNITDVLTSLFSSVNNYCLTFRRRLPVRGSGSWRRHFHLSLSVAHSSLMFQEFRSLLTMYIHLNFGVRLGAKTIKKNTNSTQNKSETHRAKQYEVTSFLSTDCELSTETCSKNIYSLGPRTLHFRNRPDVFCFISAC